MHNQRIERLWRDLNCHVLSHYREIFQTLEAEYFVDFNDSLSLFVLHYLYMDVINEELQLYQHAWNIHGLRTERYQSPMNLFLSHLNKLPPNHVDPHLYGVENDGIIVGDEALN